MTNIPSDVIRVIETIRSMASGGILVAYTGLRVGFDEDWSLGILSGDKVYRPLPFHSLMTMIETFGIHWEVSDGRSLDGSQDAAPPSA